MATATAMHAHRCKSCAEKGKQVIWIHSEACRGVVEAHTCPECGSVEKANWQQFLVEPGRLPGQTAVATPNRYDVILGYVVAFLALGLLAYVAWKYLRTPRSPLVLN